MAILALTIPEEITKDLWALDVPGESVSETEAHITMIHFGKKLPIENTSAAMKVISEVTKQFKPFVVSVGSVSTFPASESSEEKIPVICPVVSDELMKIQSQIWIALEEAGVEFSKTFPEYKPHITLSYSDSDLEDFEIEPLIWQVDELVLWCGDEGDDGMAVTFPLSSQQGHVSTKMQVVLNRLKKQRIVMKRQASIEKAFSLASVAMKIAESDFRTFKHQEGAVKTDLVQIGIQCPGECSVKEAFEGAKICFEDLGYQVFGFEPIDPPSVSDFHAINIEVDTKLWPKIKKKGYFEQSKNGYTVTAESP